MRNVIFLENFFTPVDVRAMGKWLPSDKPSQIVRISRMKKVVITGCSKGLGKALAEGFAGMGWKVAGCGRNASALEVLASRLGDPHLFLPFDVAIEGEVQVFAEKVLDAMGAPDLLVNNAALINRNATLWEVPAEEFSSLVDVNIKGVAAMIRHFVPAMIARGSGVIVNFSSGWGRSTSPEVAPYCASKWAMEGLSQALAQELPHRMACVALNPGIINTEMLQSCFGQGAAD